LDGGHAVIIVGYEIINNKPNWILQNSWGSNWADGGFFRIAAGSDLVKIESMCVGGVPVTNSTRQMPFHRYLTTETNPTPACTTCKSLSPTPSQSQPTGQNTTTCDPKSVSVVAALN